MKFLTLFFVCFGVLSAYELSQEEAQLAKKLLTKENINQGVEIGKKVLDKQIQKEKENPTDYKALLKEQGTKAASSYMQGKSTDEIIKEQKEDLSNKTSQKIEETKKEVKKEAAKETAKQAAKNLLNSFK
ncbi:hypothetical protein DMB92_04970 [Campylobacter sp. MIT 99-7217]|uniref:hypothetical protein n=1 Tax=Campylobacter sp. MIT 99-7217 TaxID=535091 RepID=UPI00115B22B9|nr:hypothetical protein [Campylobacter sp. MIT 99-7217]TQR32451.1 hypothetical protein DMB92_04970 [Campylobacter sp. MIT 99-7217]